MIWRTMTSRWVACDDLLWRVGLRALAIVGALAVALAVVDAHAALPTPQQSTRQAPAQEPTPDDTSDLPDGEGKQILVTACTTCHDLGGVRKFAGYYDKQAWQEVVDTMVANGAELKAEQVPVLVEYLAKTLGKKSKE